MDSDFNVYPEQYPVFNKTGQYLIRNHCANLERQSPQRKKRQLAISASPGFRRHCEANQGKRFSPMEQPDLTQKKAISTISNYQVSYYPTSPLNPELEEQCMLLELFRNIDKIDFRRTRFTIPSKNVRKARKLKFAADIQNFHRFQVFSCKEVQCPKCAKQKCVCGVTDQLSDRVNQKIMNRALPLVRNLRYTAKKTNYNLLSPRVESKRTRRKVNLSSPDYAGLKRDLLITPLTIETPSSFF